MHRSSSMMATEEQDKPKEVDRGAGCSYGQQLKAGRRRWKEACNSKRRKIFDEFGEPSNCMWCMSAPCLVIGLGVGIVVMTVFATVVLPVSIGASKCRDTFHRCRTGRPRKQAKCPTKAETEAEGIHASQTNPSEPEPEPKAKAVGASEIMAPWLARQNIYEPGKLRLTKLSLHRPVLGPSCPRCLLQCPF